MDTWTGWIHHWTLVAERGARLSNLVIEDVHIYELRWDQVDGITVTLNIVGKECGYICISQGHHKETLQFP
jgi:hypothetical protein